jgi:hypothetical protein
VTIKIGPKTGWNFASNSIQISFLDGTKKPDRLALSNPLASRPNHKSSIHHDIKLSENLNKKRG